jgi:hypothetical protein
MVGWGPNDFVETSTTPGEVGNLYRTYIFGLPAGTYEIRAEALGWDLNPLASTGIDEEEPLGSFSPSLLSFSVKRITKAWL